MAQKSATVDDYIGSFPPEVGDVLARVRQAIGRGVPDAEETISYGIPAFTLGGRHVVYFAGWRNHISVYPVPGGDERFERLIAPFRSGKGTLRFPLREPIPYELIERIASLLATRHAAR